MTNRLTQSQSLYLRKHAENPIDWWSWCEEALETAFAQDSPSFSQLAILAATGVLSWKEKLFPIGLWLNI